MILNAYFVSIIVKDHHWTNDNLPALDQHWPGSQNNPGPT